MGCPDLVAKLYHSHKLLGQDRVLLEEKISTMIRQPVNSDLQGVLTVAWPRDILVNDANAFMGYVMPRVENRKHIFSARRARERATLFPNYTMLTAVIIARNLAVAVNYLHKEGVIVGDFNENNILIDKKGHVTLIDADSFSITNRYTGKLYKCGVGVPDFMAPELQGRDLSSNSICFTEASDNFALAIHVFMLLMNNQHPFGLGSTRITNKSGAGSPYTKSIRNGDCQYIRRTLSNEPSEYRLFDNLPHHIKSLFKRDFSYNRETAFDSEVINNRPSAYEWAEALNKMAADLGVNEITTITDTRSNTAGAQTLREANRQNKNKPSSRVDKIRPRKKKISLLRITFVVLAAVMLNSIAHEYINGIYPRRCYERGKDYYLEGNYDEAISMFAKASEKGHCDAQYMLGCMYYDGKGVDQDCEEAFYWYYQAALNDNTYAMGMVGAMELSGYGTEQDVDEGVEWLTEAAERGDKGSISFLSNVYKYGYFGTQVDLERARFWSSKIE